MKKLLAVLAAVVVLLACSTAWAGRIYVGAAPVVVYRPAAPVVAYYAPAVPVVPAPVMVPAPMVVPAPVVAPTPVLTPEALVYPGTVVYPAPVVRARVYYGPVRPVYRLGVIVP
jgi:hypothetical protein